MPRKVILSNRAAIKLNAILSYLETEWPEKSKRDFIKKLDDTFNRISQNPKAFPASQKFPQIRKCVITKQVSVFYKYNSNKVFIITFFDNRQHPGRLKTELK